MFTFVGYKKSVERMPLRDGIEESRDLQTDRLSTAAFCFVDVVSAANYTQRRCHIFPMLSSSWIHDKRKALRRGVQARLSDGVQAKLSAAGVQAQRNNVVKRS